MNKKLLKETKEELTGEEYNILELSNKLVDLGFEDICEFGNWDEILNDGNVVVAVQDDWEKHIKIDFNVVYKNSEDESINATIIEVIDVEDFS